jgi:hypothetical protein
MELPESPPSQDDDLLLEMGMEMSDSDQSDKDGESEFEVKRRPTTCVGDEYFDVES